jgi:hypothetical protein
LTSETNNGDTRIVLSGRFSLSFREEKACRIAVEDHVVFSLRVVAVAGFASIVLLDDFLFRQKQLETANVQQARGGFSARLYLKI